MNHDEENYKRTEITSTKPFAPVNSSSYQFEYKQTWFGIVLMFRQAEAPMDSDRWVWGPWRKAEWSDMHLLKEGILK